MSIEFDIANFVNKASGAVKKSVQRKVMNEFGLEVIKMIQVRVRLGYGVRREGAPKQPLRRLSKSYIEFRKRNRHRLSEYASPGKSNLTFTGEYLDSFDANAKDGRVQVGPTGKRNIDIAKYV
jgi:hypothetical protein